MIVNHYIVTFIYLNAVIDLKYHYFFYTYLIIHLIHLFYVCIFPLYYQIILLVFIIELKKMLFDSLNVYFIT